MPVSDRGEHSLPQLGFAPVFLANLLPLVGVFQFGWDPATLVVMYTLELLVSVLLAGVMALFAHQPPDPDEDGSVLSVSHELTEKRGGIEVVSWLPPIFPRNLPFAMEVWGFGALIGLFIGAVLSVEFVAVTAVLTRSDVLLSTLGLIVGQSMETYREFRRGSYETTSPYAVVETPARQTFFVTFVVACTYGFSVVDIEALLGIVVLGKLIVEWSAYRARQGDGGWLTGWFSGPESDTEDDPVLVPDTEPEIRVPTDTRAVLFTGILHALSKYAPMYAMQVVFAWIVLLIIFGSGNVTGAVAIGAAVVVVAAHLGVLAAAVGLFSLRYAPLEYQRYDDQIVAYDTLLAEPQWSTSVDVLRDVEVVPDRLPDRILDTRTIAVTTGWSDDESRRQLGPVADPDRLVEAFDLPVESMALAPLDRRPAAVVITCLVGGLATFALLIVGPWLSWGVLLSEAMNGAVGIMIGAFVLRWVWNQSYPERND